MCCLWLIFISYSAVSWASSKSDVQGVHVIQNWPNQSGGSVTVSKVPSAVSYKNGQLCGWGWHQSRQEQSNVPHVKLLLEDAATRKAMTTSKSVSLERPPDEDLPRYPEAIVADYLEKLWMHTLSEIEHILGQRMREASEYLTVITVPAIWSDRAKASLAAIARKATHSPIKFVTDPEAAAISVLNDRTAMGSLALSARLSLRPVVLIH